MKNLHPALLSLVTIGTITSALTLVLTIKDHQAIVTREGWDTYTSVDGDFHFQKPEEITVRCKDEICTLLPITETNQQPAPDMTISVQDGQVTFSSWEDFKIPYFNDLVSSFEFEK